MIPTMPSINYLIRFFFPFRALEWTNAIAREESLNFVQKIKKKSFLLLSIFFQLRHCIILSYFEKKYSEKYNKAKHFSRFCSVATKKKYKRNWRQRKVHFEELFMETLPSLAYEKKFLYALQSLPALQVFYFLRNHSTVNRNDENVEPGAEQITKCVRERKPTAEKLWKGSINKAGEE